MKQKLFAGWCIRGPDSPWRAIDLLKPTYSCSYDILLIYVFLFWSRWWFQEFFIFSPIWGRFPLWLIFLRWVETTNQWWFDLCKLLSWCPLYVLKCQCKYSISQVSDCIKNIREENVSQSRKNSAVGHVWPACPASGKQMHASNFATLILLLWDLTVTFAFECWRIICSARGVWWKMLGVAFEDSHSFISKSMRWECNKLTGMATRNSGYFEQVHLTPCLCTFGIR